MSRKGLYYNLVLAQTLDKTIDENTAKNWYAMALQNFSYISRNK